jgi:hypothetical protein
MLKDEIEKKIKKITKRDDTSPPKLIWQIHAPGHKTGLTQ